jgi:hypothetical protein
MSGPVENEPMPVRNLAGQVRVFPLVHQDLAARERHGRAEYGGPLVTNDGRASLWDAYQEALDLAVYLRKAIVEKDELDMKVARMRDKIDAQAVRIHGYIMDSQTVERKLEEVTEDLEERDGMVAHLLQVLEEHGIDVSHD